MTRFFLSVMFLTSIALNLSAQTGAPFPQNATDISPLLIGEQIPDIVLKNVDGEAVSIHQLFKNKPTLLIFYRGGWCPFCNKHLAELQAIESDIHHLGYQIVAISPDAPHSLKESLDKHTLTYQLLSDSKMALSQATGIAFAVKESAKQRLSEASGGDNPGLLPVPTVMVLNQNSEILFEYINPDFKKRVSGDLLLGVLKALKQ